MFTKIVLISFLLTLPNVFGQKKQGYLPGSVIRVPKFKYRQSYRDFVVVDLSPAMKELFFSINVHPSCREKKGFCIPRGSCIGKKMLYLTRVCYKHDLVCCYEDFPPPNSRLSIVRDPEPPPKPTKSTTRREKTTTTSIAAAETTPPAQSDGNTTGGAETTTTTP